MINLNEKTRSLIRQSVVRTDICRMNESWRYPQALSWLFEYEKNMDVMSFLRSENRCSAWNERIRSGKNSS